MSDNSSNSSNAPIINKELGMFYCFLILLFSFFIYFIFNNFKTTSLLSFFTAHFGNLWWHMLKMYEEDFQKRKKKKKTKKQKGTSNFRNILISIVVFISQLLFQKI